MKEGQHSGIGRREEHEVDAEKIIGVRRGHIAVIPIEDSSLTSSGLYIPEEAKQRSDHGIVLVRGSDTPDIRVGDHVLFTGYSGTKISLRGQGTLIIMPYIEVLAILPNQHEVLIPLTDALNMLERAATRTGNADHGYQAHSPDQEDKYMAEWLTEHDSVLLNRLVENMTEELEGFERRGFEF